MMTEQKEQFYSQVERILDEVREPLILHGGNVELVSANPETGIVEVRLHGACVGCPIAQITLKGGIEATLMEQIPAVKEVRAVE